MFISQSGRGLIQAQWKDFKPTRHVTFKRGVLVVPKAPIWQVPRVSGA